MESAIYNLQFFPGGSFPFDQRYELRDLIVIYDTVLDDQGLEVGKDSDKINEVFEVSPGEWVGPDEMNLLYFGFPERNIFLVNLKTVGVLEGRHADLEDSPNFGCFVEEKFCQFWVNENFDRFLGRVLLIFGGWLFG